MAAEWVLDGEARVDAARFEVGRGGGEVEVEDKGEGDGGEDVGARTGPAEGTACAHSQAGLAAMVGDG